MAVVLILCESFVVLSLALIRIFSIPQLEGLKKLMDSTTTGNDKSWVYESQRLLEKCIITMGPDLLPYSDSYNATVEQLNSTIPICESLRINYWRPGDLRALVTNLTMLDNEFYGLREFYAQTLKDIKEQHTPAAIAQWIYRNHDKRIVPVNYFMPGDDEILRKCFHDIFDGPGPMRKMPVGIYKDLFRQLSAGQIPFYIMQRCKELGILDDGSSMPGLEDAEGENMRHPCHELIRYGNANADERDLFCYTSSIPPIYQVLVDIFVAAFKDSKVGLGTQSRDAIVSLLRWKVVDLHPENFMDPFFAQRIVLDFAQNRNITPPKGIASRSGTAVLFSKSELERLSTWLQKLEETGTSALQQTSIRAWPNIWSERVTRCASGSVFSTSYRVASNPDALGQAVAWFPSSIPSTLEPH